MIQTFIFTHDTRALRLRDMGFVCQADLFSEGHAVAFGMDGQGHRTPLKDRPIRFFQFDDKTYVTGATEAFSGDRLDGWFTVTSRRKFRRRTAHKTFSVLFRDMAKLYPKQIDIQPDGAVVIHAWPADWDAKTLRPPADARTAGAMKALHFGPMLELSPSATWLAPLLKLPDKSGAETALETNGMGAAVTMDMLLLAEASPASLDRIAARRRIYASWPHALPSNASLESAGVLRSGAAAGSGSKTAERVRKVVWAGLMAREARLPQNGMFNFLSFRRQWLAEEKRWSLDRPWVDNSYGVPALLWRLYFRTGGRDFGLAALRNTARLADVSVCHFATPAMAEAKETGMRKRLGGFAKPVSLIHWYAAHGLTEPWARGDFLAKAWRMTDTPRARDCLLAWTGALRALERPPTGGAADG